MTAKDFNNEEIAELEARLSLKKHILEDSRRSVITDVSTLITFWAKKCNCNITNIYIKENSKSVYVNVKYYDDRAEKNYSDDFIQLGFIDGKMFVYPNISRNIDPDDYVRAALIHFLHLSMSEASIIEGMYKRIDSIPNYFNYYESYQKENGFLEFKLQHIDLLS